MRHDYLAPCSPGDPEAVEMTWMEVDGDKLKEPEVDMNDFLKSLKTAKPSVGEEDVREHIKWTAQFGSEVSDCERLLFV